LVQIFETAAGQLGHSRLDVVRLEEGQQLAGRDREVELAVRTVRIGAEAVDPDYPPAAVEQRPARIAARDRGGVEDRVEQTARPLARNEPAALHRRLRMEDVLHSQA